MFMEQILESFQKKQISIFYADGAGYYYYELFCFDQDIFKFIPKLDLCFKRWNISELYL